MAANDLFGWHDRRHLRRTLMFSAVALALALSFGSGVGAADDPSRPRPQPADWADPQFQQPYIDKDEWRDTPVRHRYIHGGFKGTDTKFSLYFAPKELYQGRFFHHVMHISGNENNGQLFTGGDSNIGFAIASGGYFVESNLGRLDGASGNDGTLTGWRASAAVAKFGRGLAAEMYGPHRPYGYIYGGSGGGYKTMSAVENTVGIWDGSAPYIIGSPMAIPNVYTVRVNALRLLKDKVVGVVDAIDPGGSGDMYAGLDKDQRAALLEAHRFGVPPKMWAFYETLRSGGGANEGTYAEDFWKVPGYLGANPPVSLLRDRVQHTTKVVKILTNDEVDKLSPLPVPPTISPRDVPPVRMGLQLEMMPKADPTGARVTLKSGAASGRGLSVGAAAGKVIVVTAGGVADGIKSGDEVYLDNSNALASQTFHRHQVPTADYPAWNQFRGPDGKPLYPQRAVLTAPRSAEAGAGSVQNGKFNGKMIVVSTLMDEAALPWNAAWYRELVKSVKGSDFDNVFRHYWADNALHGAIPNGKHNARIVNYNGVLQQALRDVSAWAEKGTAPPASTAYKLVDDAQVVVPATAAERGGVQPVVNLTVNGKVRADVKVGQAVKFDGIVEVPPGTGQVMLADWDFEGTGQYPEKGDVRRTDASGARATVTTSHTFTKPGTYFVALRVGSQRHPDGTPYGIARNLGRVRVVVK